MPVANKDFESEAGGRPRDIEAGRRMRADKKTEKGERDKKEKEDKSQKIEHKDAKKPVALIASLLKGDTTEARNNIDEIKKTLEKYGVSVRGKTDNDVIRKWQDLLRSGTITEAKADDWNYPEGTAERALEEEEWQRMLAAVKNSKLLEDEQIADRLTVEDYLPIRKKNKVGTTPGGEDEEGEWVSELPEEDEVQDALKPYISRVRKAYENNDSDILNDVRKSLTDAMLSGRLDANDENVKRVDETVTKGKRAQEAEFLTRRQELASQTGRGYRGKFRDTEYEVPMKRVLDGLAADPANAALQQEVENLINEAARFAEAGEPKNYRMVYYRAKAAREALAAYENKLGENIVKRLEQLVGKGGYLEKLDEKYQRRYEELKREQRDMLVGDINQQASTFYKQIAAGWGSPIDEAKAYLLQMVGVEDETGLREWRAVKSVEGLDDAIRTRQLTEVPVIWQEVAEQIANVYTTVESTDLSVEEMGQAINEAIALVRRVPSDSKEARLKRDELIKQLESFRAWHALRITLQRKDMNPQAVQEVFSQYFEGKEEVTLEAFLERFEKDSLGRKYVVEKDESGNILEKPEGINLFDVSYELYSERLQDERIMMNMIEEMTKHGIGHQFSGSVLEQMKRDAGFYDAHGKFALPKRWSKERWEAKLEELRQYFLNKAGSRANEWGVANPGVKLAKDLVDKWYTKKTLIGAYGTVGEDDIDSLAEEFTAKGYLTEGEDSKKWLRSRFLSKSFIAVRQQELLWELEKKIGNGDMDIKVEVEGEKPKGIDLQEFEAMGVLDSVNLNAYHFAWMMQWSNMDNIRIYGRDPNEKGLKDVYRHVVFNHSTNLFFARATDHVWEFYHDTNENRGRAKENDINDLWKQHLPGKHNYIFPQNTMMVRWAYNFFMNDDEKKIVDHRVEELQREHDFSNKKYSTEFTEWMRSVAVMDMIENGQFTFGSRKSFSKAVTSGDKLRKFEFIDLYADRTKHLKFTDPDGLQEYLADPSEGKFFELNDKVKQFYSTRVARLFPWMTLAFRAHWDFQSKHRKEIFDTPNLISAQGETMAHALVASGDMERKQGEKEIRRAFGFKELKIGGSWGIPKIVNINLNKPGVRRIAEVLGTRPFRITRQTLELVRRTLWEMKLAPITVPRDFLLGLLEGFIKNFNKGVFGR